MKVRKVIRKDLKDAVKESDGVNVSGMVNAVVSANVNEPGSHRTHVSSHQRIVQRDGRTEVFEEHHSSGDEPDESTNKEESSD